MIVEQNATFEASLDLGATGRVGQVGVRVIDNQGNTSVARSTAGIIEAPAGLGIYQSTGMIAPGAAGQYTIVWDDPGIDRVAIEDLIVVASGSEAAPLPAVPAEGASEPVLGPCTAWTTGDAVAACAGIEVGSSNEALLDQVAVEASMLLWELSGKKYAGSCDSGWKRPCVSGRECLGSWGSYYYDGGFRCGCGMSSEVWLDGYPVTSVVQVLIDGEEVDPDTYQLRDWARLVRVRDPAEPTVALFWPSCQNMDLDETQEGTFAVRYLYGVNPPPIGARAAAELAAELYRACPGTEAGECSLPIGATQVTRQGVTYDLGGFTSFAFDRSSGRWLTGMQLNDAFLNAYAPNGHRRSAAFWGPDGPQFPERVPGLTGS